MTLRFSMAQLKFEPKIWELINYFIQKNSMFLTLSTFFCRFTTLSRTRKSSKTPSQPTSSPRVQTRPGSIFVMKASLFFNWFFVCLAKNSYLEEKTQNRQICRVCKWQKMVRIIMLHLSYYNCLANFFSHITDLMTKSYIYLFTGVGSTPCSFCRQRFSTGRPLRIW